MKAQTMTKVGPGRPKGSKTQNKETVQVVLSRCPHCGSTERTKYQNPRIQEYPGIDPQGRSYKRTVWRHTKCVQCGQARIDKAYEN